MKELSRYQDTVIGSYHPGRLIGVGPVSRVYLIEDRDRSARQLAIKLFEAVPLDQQEEKDQALDEVRLLACLEHPAILPLLDDGMHENMLYLVEPYIETGSLRQKMTAAAGELLPLKEVMALLRQVGEALQFAHAQQMVHANLKPENILLQADGKVLLADFLLPGLVKTERAARILSTFAALYMAPEQFQGHTTPLSDQYALACLAYELLTGQPPFEGEDGMSLARKHATREPLPPSQLQPKRAQHIDHVILKALVKRPTGRYPDIQTFLAELSAPPPLISVASAPGSILGVAQPPEAQPAELPTIALVPVQETEVPQASVPAALPIFDQETLRQEPLPDQPTLSAPAIHEVATIAIPAAVPAMMANLKQPGEFVPARRGVLSSRKPTLSRLSRRQIWLTVVLVVLALGVSISGIALFWGATTNHSQANVVGGTTPTLASTATQVATTGSTVGVVAAKSPTARATHRPTTTPKAKPSPTPTKAHPTATPTFNPTATPSPTAAAVVASCKVGYQVSSRWSSNSSSGFVADLTLTNTGTSELQGWTLNFTFPGPEYIYSGWSGHFKQNGNQVTVSNDNTNSTLATGAQINLGFQALSLDKNGGITPDTFTLNGVTCQ